MKKPPIINLRLSWLVHGYYLPKIDTHKSHVLPQGTFCSILCFRKSIISWVNGFIYISFRICSLDLFVANMAVIT